MSVETIRELVAKIGIDIDEKTFAIAETLINGLKTGLIATIGATAGAVGGLLAVASSTANAANEARKAAIRTGTTTEAYQELKFAAEAAGVDVGSLESALFRMSAASFQARKGSVQAAQAFKGLLTGNDLKTLSVDQQFEKIAEGLIAIKDAGERAARVRAIFGRGGDALLPLLARGKEGIADLRKEAHELGVVLDTETIANAKEFQENLHATEAMLEGLKFQLGGAVLSALVKFQRWVHKISEDFKEWRKAHPDFFLKAFRLVVAGLAALAVANAGAVASVVAGWATMAAAAVADALVVIGSWIAAALPFAATAAAVVLLALVLEDLYGFLTGKKSVIGDAVSDIKYLYQQYDNFWQLLKDIKNWVANSTGFLSPQELDAQYGPHNVGGGGVTPPDIAAQGYVQSGTTRGGMPTYVPANSVTAHVTVNASPGMSAEQVAQQVVEQLDRITREAQAAAQ